MTIVLVPQGQTFDTAQQVKGSGQGDSPMGAEFDGKKINVVGGNSGMGQPAAFDVIDRGGRRSRRFNPRDALAPPPTRPKPSPLCSPINQAGSPARFSKLMAASWPAAISPLDIPA
jgi:hypothetical protein